MCVCACVCVCPCVWVGVWVCTCTSRTIKLDVSLGAFLAPSTTDNGDTDTQHTNKPVANRAAAMPEPAAQSYRSFSFGSIQQQRCCTLNEYSNKGTLRPSLHHLDFANQAGTYGARSRLKYSLTNNEDAGSSSSTRRKGTAEQDRKKKKNDIYADHEEERSRSANRELPSYDDHACKRSKQSNKWILEYKYVHTWLV